MCRANCSDRIQENSKTVQPSNEEVQENGLICQDVRDLIRADLERSDKNRNASQVEHPTAQPLIVHASRLYEN